MEEVVKFLKENPTGCLASVDNGKPRARPWGFMLEENGKFYFTTNNTKDVFKQLNTVPFVEFTSSNKANDTWVRISGEIIFIDEIKQKNKIIEANPFLKNVYKSGDNPIFEVFYIEHGAASISSFANPTPKKFDF